MVEHATDNRVMQVQFSHFLPIQLHINYIKNLTLLKKFDIINIQAEKVCKGMVSVPNNG